VSLDRPDLLVVGLDPSLSGTGLAFVRMLAEPDVLTITSPPVPNAKYPPTMARLRKIVREVLAAVAVHRLEGDIVVVVMEGPAFASTTGLAHVRGGLWWLLYHMLEKDCLMVVIEPSKLKRYVTGKGNAPKEVMFATTVRNFPRVGIMNNNESDALGLACMAARELGIPQEPSTNRVTPAALEGVDWPAQLTQRR